MAKYLFEVHYSVEGIKGLKGEGGSARVAASTEFIRNLGGTVECFYFAFGEADAYIIAEFPDNVTAAAGALTAGAGGGTATKTVVLLTPPEIDEAAANSAT